MIIHRMSQQQFVETWKYQAMVKMANYLNCIHLQLPEVCCVLFPSRAAASLLGFLVLWKAWQRCTTLTAVLVQLFSTKTNAGQMWDKTRWYELNCVPPNNRNTHYHWDQSPRCFLKSLNGTIFGKAVFADVMVLRLTKCGVIHKCMPS